MPETLVTALLTPPGTALAVLGAYYLACLRVPRWRTRRAGGVVTAVALAWLYVWSTPCASEALRGWLESAAGPRLLAAQPSETWAVVLGGGIEPPRPPARPDPNLREGADRTWHAARLYRAEHISRILLSGGSQDPGAPSEASAMRTMLLDLGVPDDALLLEETSTTTASNARHSAALLCSLGVHRAVLVTSALHMRRARLRFAQAGIETLPAPTDFQVVARPFSLARLLPEGEAIQGSGRAFKEWLGVWQARLLPIHAPPGTQCEPVPFDG